MEYALELRNLTKHYDGFTLDHVSFGVPKGSIVGFVGENGAGKSTTIKAAMDLIRTEEGEVLFFGSKGLTKEKKEDIGVVFDESTFHDYMNISMINKVMSKIYRNWDEKQFLDYCNRFSLSEKKVIKDYSRGMKMKLTIAVALSHKAKLLLLDEATSGLDPIVRDEILEIFGEYIQDEEHSVLLSSHIVSDLEKICDYITFLHKGKLVFFENKDNLLYQYGIVKCSAEEYRRLDKSYVEWVKAGTYDYEVLVNDKQKVAAQYRDLVIDRPTIEDIMLLIVKGERP